MDYCGTLRIKLRDAKDLVAVSLRSFNEGGELCFGGVGGLGTIENGSKSEFWVKEKPDWLLALVQSFGKVDPLARQHA